MFLTWWILWYGVHESDSTGQVFILGCLLRHEVKNLIISQVRSALYDKCEWCLAYIQPLKKNRIFDLQIECIGRFLLNNEFKKKLSFSRRNSWIFSGTQCIGTLGYTPVPKWCSKNKPEVVTVTVCLVLMSRFSVFYMYTPLFHRRFSNEHAFGPKSEDETDSFQ